MSAPFAHLPPFLLASGSPRRQQLLAEAGARFVVQASTEPEPDPAAFTDPIAYVTHTAWLKAERVAAARRSPAAESKQPLSGSASGEGDDWLILAADTVAAHAGQILGKPADRGDAARILELLMGTVHDCLTGVCVRLRDPQYSLVFAEVTRVHMRPLTPAQLDRYLDSGDWQGKAGAYGIQLENDPFVTAVEGSWTNVMGLPMERLTAVLRRLLPEGVAGGSE